MNGSQGVDTQTNYADLPPELVDHIFRYACILSTSFCLTLSLTSKWTRNLAVPYLYSTIFFKKIPLKFYQQLKSTLPRDRPTSGLFPNDYIHSIWTEHTEALLLPIFQNCNNLSRLALRELNFRHIVDFVTEQDVRRKPDIHILVIQGRYKDWCHPVEDSPLYSRITHLRVGNIHSYSESHLDLAHFTRLSHIAVPYHDPGRQPLSKLLSIFDDVSPRIILVVVILTDYLSENLRRVALQWVLEERMNNPNIFAVFSRHEDLRNEWEEEARNGLSIWDKAKLFTQSLSSL